MISGSPEPTPEEPELPGRRLARASGPSRSLRPSRSAQGAVLGLVVCGGASRRMGADKALLELDGQTLLERAVGVLEPLAQRVVLATGREPRYVEQGLEVVLDAVPDAGPLAGLEAGLELARREGHEWVFALAVDMPRVRPAHFRALVARAEERALDACMLGAPEGLEPLLAFYRSSVHGAVRRALDRGERRLISFHPEIRVEALPVAELAPGLAADEPTSNLNTRDALAREEMRKGSPR